MKAGPPGAGQRRVRARHGEEAPWGDRQDGQSLEAERQAGHDAALRRRDLGDAEAAARPAGEADSSAVERSPRPSANVIQPRSSASEILSGAAAASASPRSRRRSAASCPAWRSAQDSARPAGRPTELLHRAELALGVGQRPATAFIVRPVAAGPRIAASATVVVGEGRRGRRAGDRVTEIVTGPATEAAGDCRDPVFGFHREARRRTPPNATDSRR